MSNTLKTSRNLNLKVDMESLSEKLDRAEKRLYSLRESAAQLNLSYSTIKAWVHMGKIPVVRLGSRTMIKASILNQLAEEGLDSIQSEGLIDSTSDHKL